MIMKLKIYTTGKMFGKICLKPVGDIFFQYVICNQERDGVRQKKKILKSMRGLNTVIILKRMRERVYFLSKQQTYNM